MSSLAQKASSNAGPPVDPGRRMAWVKMIAQVTRWRQRAEHDDLHHNVGVEKQAQGRHQVAGG
jgi:hypothetical protein